MDPTRWISATAFTTVSQFVDYHLVVRELQLLMSSTNHLVFPL